MDEKSDSNINLIIRLLLVIVLQAPIFGGAFRWQKIAEEHPFITVGILILYELFVFLLYFSKKVWKEFEAEAIKCTKDWIWECIKRISWGFQKQYYKY